MIGEMENQERGFLWEGKEVGKIAIRISKMPTSTIILTTCKNLQCS